MKGNLKKIMAIFLSVCLLGAVTSTKVFAKNSKDTPASAKVTFVWCKTEAKMAKDWFDSANELGKGVIERELANSKNESEKAKLKKASDEWGKRSSANQFVDRADGSTSLEVPLPFVELKIGDYSTIADEKGKFSVNGLSEGEYPLTIFFEGAKIYESIVVVEENKKNLDINIQIPGSNIFAAADKMGESMAAELDSEQVKSMTTYYPNYPVGSIVPGSSGAGTMRVVAPNNIVGCNKADKTMADSANFPRNWSDCSSSIVLGTAYAANPIINFWFYRSYNCFLESLQNTMGTDGANVYCNGKYKSGHYNCSWFRGISHSERLHTH